MVCKTKKPLCTLYQSLQKAVESHFMCASVHAPLRHKAKPRGFSKLRAEMAWPTLIVLNIGNQSRKSSARKQVFPNAAGND